MKRKIAVIHTTPVTVSALTPLITSRIPDCEIINYVDDSILPSLRDNAANEKRVEKHWTTYAVFAEEEGAECVLSACSSVGDIAERAAKAVAIPVLRIDEAMAEQAVASGSRIGVAATLATTMGPTMRLLERKASQTGKIIQWKQAVVSEAYEKLMAGDQEGHDRLLAAALAELGNECDVVVLAQASMARVLDTLPSEVRSKFLTSPKSGVERLREVLGSSKMRGENK
ncbi:aspartate/glutamate racemase family protein [Paenibacillus faecalis]|uniref:aspartate/glutamate racemase family protein n=1 Tax=Paenibacillus faecalis TaxID=2079532 RepID=UPI000D104C5B|nr:aspartate/glutamate racemase family protein [Paenibacillus faecalis]